MNNSDISNKPESRGEKVAQIPTEYNEQQTLRLLRKQNRIAGEERVKTISNIPITAATGQVLKDLAFPTNKKRILHFLRQKMNNNPKCHEILPVLEKIEQDKVYKNVFEVTKATGLVE